MIVKEDLKHLYVGKNMQRFEKEIEGKSASFIMRHLGEVFDIDLNMPTRSKARVELEALKIIKEFFKAEFEELFEVNEELLYCEYMDLKSNELEEYEKYSSNNPAPSEDSFKGIDITIKYKTKYDIVNELERLTNIKIKCNKFSSLGKIMMRTYNIFDELGVRSLRIIDNN
jgi:hypothetical protein